MSGSSSITHLPNFSVDGGKGDLFPVSPGEYEAEELSPRSPHSQAHWPTQVPITNSSALQHFSPTFSSIGPGLLKLSKKKLPLSASKALGGGGPKRKLCIGGVALDDMRAVERVKAWCEVSFLLFFRGGHWR